MVEDLKDRDLLPREGEDETDGTLGELYHENSKQRRHDLEFGRRVWLANHSTAFHDAAARAFKRYPGAAVTSLPRTDQGRSAVEQTIVDRRSVRSFTGAALSLAELARLLAAGNGITARLPARPGAPRQPVRAAPSGGALYPVELYPLVLSVGDVEPGVFHYRVDQHSLELVRGGDVRPPLFSITGDPELLSAASVAIVLTSVLGRGQFKYGERAYRFAMLEAGHLAQNLLLSATSLGLASVPVGGFIDDELNDLLDLDGVDEAAVYVVVVGRPQAPRAPEIADGGAAAELAERILRSLPGDPSAAPDERG